MIAPSERLDDIAAKHLGSLPLPIRAMLRGLGVSGEGDSARGAALASYLLFEAPYTRELIALGVHDTLARRDEVISFFGWDARSTETGRTAHRNDRGFATARVAAAKPASERRGLLTSWSAPRRPARLSAFFSAFSAFFSARLALASGRSP